MTGCKRFGWNQEYEKSVRARSFPFNVNGRHVVQVLWY